MSQMAWQPTTSQSALPRVSSASTIGEWLHLQHPVQHHIPAAAVSSDSAPSHLCSTQSKSPKSDRKNVGMPDQEFIEQKSATECLTSMIEDCKKLFRIPEDFMSKCSLSYMEAAEPASLSLLGVDSDYEAHVQSCIQGLVKVRKLLISTFGDCLFPRPESSWRILEELFKNSQRSLNTSHDLIRCLLILNNLRQGNTVKSDLIATEIVTFPSKSLRKKMMAIP